MMLRIVFADRTHLDYKKNDEGGWLVRTGGDTGWFGSGYEDVSLADLIYSYTQSHSIESIRMIEDD